MTYLPIHFFVTTYLSIHFLVTTYLPIHFFVTTYLSIHFLVMTYLPIHLPRYFLKPERQAQWYEPFTLVHRDVVGSPHTSRSAHSSRSGEHTRDKDLNVMRIGSLLILGIIPHDISHSFFIGPKVSSQLGVVSSRILKY